MNIRWTLGLGVIAIALLAWFYQLNQEDPSLTNLVKNQESPEYIGQKMQTVVFSPTGQKQYVAQSQSVEYYQKDEKTVFQQPILFLFNIENRDTQQKENWKLSAKQAVLTKQNLLFLEGDVVVESLFENAKLKRIETESAQVDLKTQDISSEKMVKIVGQNFTTTGNKLDGNLQQQIAKLREQVKTQYEINNK